MKHPTRNPQEPAFGNLHDAERDERPDDRSPLEFSSRHKIDLLPIDEDHPDAGAMAVGIPSGSTERASASFAVSDTRADLDPGDPDVADSPWAVLRSHRERRAMTLADVARATRLKVELLQRLERNETDGIPGTYLKGYLRAYAKAVDVPIESLPVQLHGLREPDLVPDLAAANRRAQGKAGTQDGVAMRLVLPVVLVGALGAGAWWWLGGGEDTHGGAIPEPLASLWQENDGVGAQQAAPASGSAPRPAPTEPASEPSIARNQTAPTPPAAESTRTDEASDTRGERTDATVSGAGDGRGADAQPREASGNSATESEAGVQPDAASTAAGESQAAQAAQAARAAADDGRARLRLRVTEPAWVEIRSADRDRVLSEVLQPGADQTVTAEYPVRVVIGFAPGVTVEWNGEAYDLAPHSRGDRTARFTLQAP